MSPTVTVALALTMAAIAVANVALMAWLWRFPMVPDPTGRDPAGVSTAPRSWTNVHRGLGYVFVLAYLALLVEMVPRLWEFREVSVAGAVHGVLGLLVGAVLAGKIAVLRRFRRFGHRLPWIGGTLAAVTLAVVGLGVVPAWQVLQPLTPLPPELDRGRDLVAVRCLQCHGASTVAGEDGDADDWDETTRKMQRRAARAPGAQAISEAERVAIAAYLTQTQGEDGDDRGEHDRGEDRDDDRDDDSGRRRRRGRDH